MKDYRFLFSLFVILTCFSPAGEAQRWLSVDTRHRAVGHAGTAGSSGLVSIYWNPASLTAETDGGRNSSRVHLDGMVDLAIEGDVIASADRLVDQLNETSLDDLQDRFDEGEISEGDIRGMLEIIGGIADLTEPGSGVVADVGGGLAYQRGSLAFSYRYYSRIGLTAVLDTGPGSGLSLADDGLEDLNNGLERIVQQRIDNGETLNRPETEAGRVFSQDLRDLAAEQGVILSQAASDEMAFQGEQVFGDALIDGRTAEVLRLVLDSTVAATGGDASDLSIAQNDSGLEYRGIRFHELTLAKGFDLGKTGHDIRIGLAGRVLQGRTFLRRLNFREIEDGRQVLGEVFDSFDSRVRESTRMTVDAGLTYSPREWLTLGLSGRNLVPVSFPFRDGRDFDLEPQARAGLSLQPASLPWLKLMMDGDLTKNSTDTAPGFESRILGGGVEITTWIRKAALSLRGGTFVNLASEELGQVYTAGLELRYGAFFVSAEGHVTADNVDIESASIETSRRDFPERLGGSVAMGFELWF